MKSLARMRDPEDLVTKEYVDTNIQEIDLSKLELSDLNEITNSQLLELWNQFIEDDEDK